MKEEIRYTVRIVSKTHQLFDRNTSANGLMIDNEIINNLTALVTEIRKVRGLFYERLEINDFPFDLHELSIVIASLRNKNEVVIVEDKTKPTVINPARFYDRQEWSSFSFCRTTEHDYVDQFNGITSSQLKLSCFVVRRHQFYVYK